MHTVVCVVEHRDQFIHDLRCEEMIEELTALITHVGALMRKSFSNRGRASSPQLNNARWAFLA